EDLALRRWQEWYESANRGYVVMKNLVDRMAIVGFSTGAGVALLQAVNKPDAFRCVVSVNAPLRLKNIASRFTNVVTYWNSLLGKMHVRGGTLEFVPNHPENPQINYFRNPVSGVRQ